MGDALVPRTSVASLSAGRSVTDLLRAARETGYSRFPVLGRSVDDVVGVAGLRDALAIDPVEREGSPVTEVTRPAVIVPKAAPISAAWERLDDSGEQLAVVVDEYGGFAGIVTLEDVLEEVVGEIDRRPVPAAEPAASLWVLPGAANAETVGELTGFEMPEGAYETLAGFLLDRLGAVPEPGATWREGGWRFRVLGVEGHRISHVEVSRA